LYFFVLVFFFFCGLELSDEKYGGLRTKDEDEDEDEDE
jgi:hypothetical protein